MAAKVFEKSAEETAFRAVLKEVYESGKNSVAVLWADAVKPAVVMVLLKLKCTSCQMFMSLVKFARVSAIIGKLWK